MKTTLLFLLLLFSYHSVTAKQLEMTLKAAKNWHNTETLDSVVVSFSAKGHQLEFRQAFQTIKGAKVSRQIALGQKDKDLEHFKSALLIMASASSRVLSDHRSRLGKIKENKQGLSSHIIFEQYLNSTDSWQSMCSVFSWAKLFGKAQDIKVIAYTKS